MAPPVTVTNDKLDRSFLDASIPELVKQLTTDEKIWLLAGQDWWSTVPIPRLNIPSVKVTDGPNGARGGSFFNMTPASALPSATSIGATFSHSTVREGGGLLALEAKARGATCLLAPTINIQRSPLGGRAFESFSEDPTLSGSIAADYVNGLQDGGVSATIKHFVGNDQEHERMGEDSIIDERTLREVYLRAFQIAQKRSKPWGYMTAYNKINGIHCSENKWLLQDILRKEWGHDGLIMSDWYGTYSVSESINAGLNLEMPGSAIWRNSGLVRHLIGAHKIDLRQIDTVASQVLTWVQKLAKLNPELVYAAPSPEKTRYEDKDSDAKLIRKLGGEGIVVLKNEKEVLPVKSKKIAVIGPNAKARVLTGGGSAQLKSAWSVSPYEGLVANKPKSSEISYALGAQTSKYLPTLDESFTALDGSAGFDLAHYAIEEGGSQAAKPAVTSKRDNSDLFMGDFYHPDLGKMFISEINALFTSPIDGEYEFGLCVTGAGWLWVDDELIIDNSKDQIPGSIYFNSGTAEKKGTVKVQKGKQYKIRVKHDGRKPAEKKGDSTPLDIHGFRVGATVVIDDQQAIKEAAAVAKDAETAIIVAGLNADWESEGYDRPNLSLPLLTNDLISAVADANPNTVVVIQAGSAVSMPWVDKVAGVIYAWYGGNEAGNAIADIVYGAVNPSGRLPISLPKREQDIAAHLNYKSARTKIHYHEGIWVGYKHHNANGIAPLYPFGHGLSYTTFEYSDLKITEKPKAGAKADDWKLGVSVKVTNTGKVAGSHSVHFYTAPPPETATSLKHPEHALQAYDKVYDLAPGASATVSVTLDKYAVSHWDDLWKTWRAELGEWAVKVGIDAQTTYGEAKFEITEDLEWTGI